MPTETDQLTIRDLGRLDYESAWDVQQEHHEAVVAGQGPETILLVEHDPVITLGKNPKAKAHILASSDLLQQQGVALVQSDRGGDVTYHGPGQLVVYPIIDLNRRGLNIRTYVRLLEAAIIATCRDFGIHAHRDRCAVGVWVGGDDPDLSGEIIGDRNSTQSIAACDTPQDIKSGRKIAAIGVRVRRWVTLHGLAINVNPDLNHFNLIVPCGLAGRPVTSMQQELGGDHVPTISAIKQSISTHLMDLIMAARQR